MKKLYSAPLMEIEKFDVEDIVTTSTPSTPPVVTQDGIIMDDNTMSGDTATYEVEIVTQW